VSHRHTEFALVADLERLHTLATGLQLDRLARDIEHAHSNIASHRFTIAVVGEFKRGKSTFINALLGKEILPSDVAPTSATINRVTYGLKPGVRIVFRNGAEEAVGIGQLSDYVTKLTPQAEAMAATVKEAIVEYPVPFCKHNVDIIDTPGLSDDAAMTAVTLEVLNRIDAAILVIMATSPFAQSEAAFLEQLLVEFGLGSVIFVVTALDRLRRQSDRDMVLQTVTERIQQRTREHAIERFGEGTEAFSEYLRRVGQPRVFGVSGYDALAAKVDGDEALLSESRFPDFESFLERFLTEESGLVALKTHAERLAGFADALRRELSARLQAPSPASDPIVQNSLEALLRSLEWLAQDAKSRLDEHRREAQSDVRHSLQMLPQELRQAADLSLQEMSPAAEDLELLRTSAFVASWREKLSETVNSVSDAKARTLVLQLRTRMAPAAELIARFGTTFDRVIGHVRAAPAPRASESGAPAQVGIVQRLGATGGFEPMAAGRAVVAALFDAHADEWQTVIFDALVGPSSWGTDIDVQPMAAGFKFAKKAMDLLRIEKFKMNLKGSLTEALARHVQGNAGARDEAVSRQVAGVYDVLGGHIEQALDELRTQRSRLTADLQRRIAHDEHERKRLEQLHAEIATIHERAKDTARQLVALEFGGV
jgi:GTPase SAR1 family protein